MQTTNPGFDPKEIEKLQAALSKSGKPFQFIEDEEVSEDMAEFHFIGKHEGKPVIYDCLLGTLQLAYESNLLEMAEAKARQKFPDYKGFDFEIDDKGNAIANAEELDEVEEYKAYAMYEIEEAGEANVAEYVEIDTNFEFGIGLEAYLNLPEITEATIIQFIEDFNAGTLKLDPVRYSFESEDEDEED
jgi:hypothetical protein